MVAQHLLPLLTIEQHPAWIGTISGLKAEKLLRGHTTPYLYLLRSGEYEGNYYVTYLLPDFTIKHQPFVIITTHEGWWFENGGVGGPFTKSRIDDVLHLIMHCAPHECSPFEPLEERNIV